MKILFVTHRYPPRTGGVETHVRELATRFADRGDDVTVFSADAGPDVPTESVIDGVQVRRFRSASPNESFYVALGLVSAISRADADVVHAHNYHALPLLFAALGVTDERFVVTPYYHGASADGLRDVLLSCYRPVGRWALRRADAVIAVSKWERDRLQTDFGVDATVIPIGINIRRFRNVEPERRARPYLLSVGRLVEYKGVQHVIRALSELPEYDLVVAGSGPYRDELEQIAAEAGVADRVEFLGYVEDEHLPGLYAGADVFVSLSSFESYGITVAEALAAGTPCVVRQTGALGDWAAKGCCGGVSQPSPESVAAEIRTVANRSVVDTGVWDVSDVAEAVQDRYVRGLD